MRRSANLTAVSTDDPRTNARAARLKSVKAAIAIAPARRTHSGPGHIVHPAAPASASARLASGREGPPPETRLLVALLAEAVHTLRKNSRRQTRRQRRLYHEVEVWICTPDDPSPFAFDRVCDLLGIDPDYLRRGLFPAD
jgi:hypothetical protein